MKAISVSCQNCSAPLDVAEGVRFLTCAFCNSRLEIHRSPTATYSTLLEKIDQRTEAMADDLGFIRIQNELDQLDREWMLERESMMVRNKNGSTSEPGGTGSLIAGIFAAGFGIVWTSLAASMGAPGFFILFGLLFAGGAFVSCMIQLSNGSRYASQRDQYNAKRRVLIQRLENHKRT